MINVGNAFFENLHTFVIPFKMWKPQQRGHSCAILMQREGLEPTILLCSSSPSTVHWHIYKFSKKLPQAF